jgi:hypothetical protein
MHCARAAIEEAIADGRRDDVPKFLTDKWLADNTLFGPAAKVRNGVAAGARRACTRRPRRPATR